VGGSGSNGCFVSCSLSVFEVFNIEAAPKMIEATLKSEQRLF